MKLEKKSWMRYKLRSNAMRAEKGKNRNLIESLKDNLFLGSKEDSIYFFLEAFSAALVTFPPLAAACSTDLITPTATV